jgi:hypothetical protein
MFKYNIACVSMCVLSSILSSQVFAQENIPQPTNQSLPVVSATTLMDKATAAIDPKSEPKIIDSIKAHNDNTIHNIVDVQAINTQAITPKYSNTPNTSIPTSLGSNGKTLFKVKEGKTQITESKEYGHSQRDIQVNSNMGAYNLSKPMNGSITDEKTKRNTSIRLMNF